MRKALLALVLLATPAGAQAPINYCEIRGEIVITFGVCDPECMTHTVQIANGGNGVNDLFVECLNAPPRFGVHHCQTVEEGDCVHAVGRLVCDAGFCRCAALQLFTEIPPSYCP